MLADIRCVIDWPGTAAFWKDVLTTAAAVFAAYIAWRGLTTWRHQTVGQQYHDLARKLLVSAYRYREAVKGIRNPVMWSGEMPDPPLEKIAKMSLDQRSHYGRRGAYIQRFKVANEAWTSAQPDILEAEALWGTQVRELFVAIMKLDNELRITIEADLVAQDPDVPELRRQAYADVKQKRRDIMYDVGTVDQPDEFERDLRAAVAAVEAELKPRLIRHDPDITKSEGSATRQWRLLALSGFWRRGST